MKNVAIYKLKSFARFARSENIPDSALLDAADRAERGLVDADLGGGLIKQRVARKGQGRSGGYRVIIAFRRGELPVYLFGFAKSAQANLDERQLNVLHGIGTFWLRAAAATIEKALEAGELVEAPR